MLGPISAIMVMANINAGKDLIVSNSITNKFPTVWELYPAISPKTKARTTPNDTDERDTISAILAPNINLLKVSLPRLSVPNKC